MGQDQLESMVDQLVGAAVATIPAYRDDIRQNEETFRVENPDEFVFGVVMGMVLGLGGAMLGSDGSLSRDDHERVKDMVYDRIPEIRKRIFG